MEDVGSYSLCHHSDALIRIGLLFGKIIFNNLSVLENIVRHIWEEGSCHKDLSNSMPMQSLNETIWFGPSTLERIREHQFLEFGIGNYIRRRAESSYVDEQFPLSWEILFITVFNASSTTTKYSEITSSMEKACIPVAQSVIFRSKRRFHLLMIRINCHFYRGM